MKRLLALILAVVMMTAATPAFARSKTVGCDPPLLINWIDVPCAVSYNLTYPTPVFAPAEPYSADIIVFDDVVDDITIRLQSTGGEHEVQVEICSPYVQLISDTLTATEDGSCYTYINTDSENTAWRTIKSLADAGEWDGDERFFTMPAWGWDDSYSVFITYPKGAAGEVSVYFSGGEVGSTLETIEMTSTKTGITTDSGKINLYEGEKTEIPVTSIRKITTVEVENENIVSASFADGVLTVEGLEPGESIVWLRTSNNSTALLVKVLPDSASGASDWAKEDIREAILAGFVPEGIQGDWQSSITREEIAQMAVKFLGLGGPYGESPFDDTNNGYVTTAYEIGIVNGVEENKFDPQGTITRRDAAVMLMRAAEYMLMRAGRRGEDMDLRGEEYSDMDSIADWYTDAVLWARAWDIMQGDENDCFNPESEYTREEAISAFWNLSRK